VGRWRIATWIAAAIWTLLMLRLMIADVWDETNGMLFFSDPRHSLSDLIAFALTQSLGFWRPLPTVIVAAVLHFVPAFAVSWRLLRAINIVLLLGAAAFLLRTIEAWSERDERRDFVTLVAFLFSGSAVIAAGWYANIFDSSALLLIALAFFLMTRSRFLLAGAFLGAAFFCKETTALALVFFLPLIAAGKLRLRDATVTAIPAVVLGLAYFGLRGRIISFGSASDVHAFTPQYYLPSAMHFLESFWRQTMKVALPAILGFAWIVLSLVALKKPRVIAAVVVFLLAATILYWGMFLDYQDGVVISHHNFVGRLFLIPVWLMIVLMAVERRTLFLAILLVPILWGGVTTYRDHVRFQRGYRHIYRLAPVTIYYPTKPLHDTVRGVEIGNLPNAKLALDPRTGQLQPRR